MDPPVTTCVVQGSTGVQITIIYILHILQFYVNYIPINLKKKNQKKQCGWSQNILRLESKGFANGLDVGHEIKRGVKDFGLSKGLNLRVIS